ncbi:peptidase-C39 like family protein [Desulfolutivibrio sulfoxidireducens]|uniref:peptidase-C39 like family protein n=1 Tax=Desulfolutivibrio sulfoxidireducens TaxID=2773299 RepID=UPI00159E0511|nr:peptidase-C39 like family protein [Desulfolutivibrio sulfoxidireducens]QLA16074.1 peptidase-C39 like family protein [Desulfolutivibrio sulfoxidireducens]QLA20016.1 peptidase-C39 like family protein [Desulfolutivibrio sulfoxidireducens]
MESKLGVEILPQPDDITCGPTCLHAVYHYYGDRIGLERVIEEVPTLEGGGTLGVLLGSHALARGYRARLYTFNLRVFDPTWFGPGAPDLAERLAERLKAARDPKQRLAARAYLRFLRRGGEIVFEDLTAALIRSLLIRGLPILTGLSATYLYRTPRERDDENGRIIYDDVRGEPSGHFVVISGYHREARVARIADPFLPNPMSEGQYYDVPLNRLICAIMLGVLTYDANMLVIFPRRIKTKKHKSRR